MDLETAGNILLALMIIAGSIVFTVANVYYKSEEKDSDADNL